MYITTKTMPDANIAAERNIVQNEDGSYRVYATDGAELIELARKLGSIERRSNRHVTVADLMVVLENSDPNALIGFRSDYRTQSVKRLTYVEEDGVQMVVVS